MRPAILGTCLWVGRKWNKEENISSGWASSVLTPSALMVTAQISWGPIRLPFWNSPTFCLNFCPLILPKPKKYRTSNSSLTTDCPGWILDEEASHLSSAPQDHTVILLHPEDLCCSQVAVSHRSFAIYPMNQHTVKRCFHISPIKSRQQIWFHLYF